MQISYPFIIITSLLRECGRLALSTLCHGDDWDVIVDAGLQSVHGVVPGGGLHHVLEYGHALPGCHYSDTVAGDRCVV